ncbi:MAG: hypothetical protein DSY80_10505 [Desulfocapsa sp.]|nr:MAG: hypothetical protein DSY80_10505 [Desulfocapsa sp.]
MQSKRRTFPSAGRILFLVFLLSTAGMFSACADSKSVRITIKSVPKGAHVLYQVKGGDSPCQDNWIYLGNTPLQAVQTFSERQLKDTAKITLRVMYNGYHDQSKEWDGEGFWREIEEKDVIFWTPELSRNIE